MRKFLTLTLLLLIFTSCEKETDFETASNSEFKKESTILFSSAKFEELSNTYSNIDKAMMDQSLEENTIDGQVLYSMDLSTEGVDLRQLFFTIENGVLENALVIENKIKEDTSDIQFDIRTSKNELLGGADLVKSDGGGRVFKVDGGSYTGPTDSTLGQGNSCFRNCIVNMAEACMQNPIVTLACIIVNNLIVANCVIRCL
ncbi:hypothetical protein [Lacinutrix sp. MEBiC02404]